MSLALTPVISKQFLADVRINAQCLKLSQ